MIVETITVNLLTGQKLKFSLREKFIVNELFFIINVIDTELNCYKQLNQFQQKYQCGIEIFKKRFESSTVRKDLLHDFSDNFVKTYCQ
jgi:hypothetical protein